ncbi:polysaccharide deacetylase family protein [Methylobacterium sp. BTF04]|uniref:polysaccharide deacetylase family protein n=1 Tax=Methylobacterium sp. BTF04 TaxID=2708300 RepID=UPI0013D5F76B|nr:polysaccharide deacetylase family protein [Methylobacterium sp. BTF04]NEU13495.1 polysaccharide deacetylase family protein [Methylobacterium sp. BTF04]
MHVDDDASKSVTLRERIAHRLGRHVPLAATRIRPSEPFVSLSFDDVPDSACTIGADILDGFGVKATYFVATGLMGLRTRYWRNADRARIAALFADGHEIGCHTHSHPILTSLSAHSIRADIEENRSRLEAIVPGAPRSSFAYPFGYTSLAAKRIAGRTFASSRSVVPGLNAGFTDPHMLHANPLVDARLDPATLERLMQRALARRGWLIFFGHDVSDDPSPYGCTPGLLTAVLAAAARRGIACVTIAEGLRRSTLATGGDESASA